MRLIALGLAELRNVKSKNGESNKRQEVNRQTIARERGGTASRARQSTVDEMVRYDVALGAEAG